MNITSLSSEDNFSNNGPSFLEHPINRSDASPILIKLFIESK